MSIHDALNSTTLSWHEVRGVRPGYDLRADSDAVATARQGEVEIGERLYRTEVLKGGTTLVDVSTGARVGSIRPMTHNVTAINVHQGRYRMSRKGVLPFMLEVTADYAGPQVLQVLRFGSTLRMKKGRALDAFPTGEIELLTVLVGMSLLDLLEPSTTAAA